MHQKTQINVSGPAGEIELDMVLPDQPNNIAVLCHSHPLYGGTMHDSVLQVAADIAATQCWRRAFNFAGGSAGRISGKPTADEKSARPYHRRKLETCWRSLAG